MMSDSRSERDGAVAEPAIDLDTRFDILSNPHRRALIAILDETPTLTRHELTTRLVATITDTTSQPTSEKRRQLRIALQHNHLPRLADACLIEYDTETVAATSTLPAVARSLSES